MLSEMTLLATQFVYCVLQLDALHVNLGTLGLYVGCQSLWDVMLGNETQVASAEFDHALVMLAQAALTPLLSFSVSTIEEQASEVLGNEAQVALM